MGHDARKPVFRGLRTSKAQTSLHIHTDGSVPLIFAYWKVSYLASSEISLFQLVSVYEETDFSLALSETQNTGFLMSDEAHIICGEVGPDQSVHLYKVDQDHRCP